MFVRIEVAVRPEFSDSAAQGMLRKIELADPVLREKIRWGRILDVYWVDIPASREEVIATVTDVCWDKVLQWVFTGNLIPSAAGNTGSVEDVMQFAPNRPGKFWGIERRFRAGVTDHVGQVLLEAFEIVLGRKIPEMRASSGSLFILEGPELNEDALASLARDIFSNELIETWTIVPEEGLKKNDRFHQERIKNDLPRVTPLRGRDRAHSPVQLFDLKDLSDEELQDLSRKNLWALSLKEMKAIREYFCQVDESERRRALGLNSPTDVELEVIAQTWSEHCKHKIFNAQISYKETQACGSSSNSNSVNSNSLPVIPSKIDSLFKSTVVATTQDLPRPWLISTFHDNAGICGFDEEDAFCIKVETHNSPSALDPYGGALTGIVGVNRDILGCGIGAKPIFNTNVFCVAPLDIPPSSEEPLPEGLIHPRRILEGVRRGVEHGGNKSGIPTVNGALVFDNRYLGKPLVYCGTGGLLPRQVLNSPHSSEVKKIVPGDRICMIGGRIGKDGIHGATFSSLALESTSPSSVVQLGDPLTQKRMSDFILEARNRCLYRALTDNGAGGLSSSVGELACLSGGAKLDVSLAKTKYPGLKPFELVISESQERMTLAVPPDCLERFLALAEARDVEVSVLGEFNDTGRFDIFYADKIVGSLGLEFLHHGVPRLDLQAEWKTRPWDRPSSPYADSGADSFGADQQFESKSESEFESKSDPETRLQAFEKEGGRVLLELLGRPNIASKEWLIRQYDHEVQGTSVVKPLHSSTTFSGPNDAGVVRPKFGSDKGLAVGCGINPKLSDFDPFLMAQSAVDEAVRNVLCVGAEYGTEDCVLALVDNFCWSDPVENKKMAGALVRACYGMREAALALKTPLVSGKDSMKNDYQGKVEKKRQNGSEFLEVSEFEDVKISVPPTLLMTAVGRVPDVKKCRTADYKAAGDLIYLLGPGDFGGIGSEFLSWREAHSQELDGIKLGSQFGPLKVGLPHWETARAVYRWIGGKAGGAQDCLKSLHDVSEGGLLVAVAEGLLSRGWGATLYLPKGAESERREKNIWEITFGEGFHSFIATLSMHDQQVVEAEWKALGIPYQYLGKVETHDRLEVFITNSGTRSGAETGAGENARSVLNLGIQEIRSAWLKEGYWE